MKGVLHIVGLGPAGLDKLTVGSYRLLQQADKVFFRTGEHPCARELAAEGLSVEAFDNLYQAAGSFDQVYAEIVVSLRTALQHGGGIVYAVPGNPRVAEKSVRLILDQLSSEFKVIVHAGLSFLDELFLAVPLDPIEGVTVCNYDGIHRAGFSGRDWLVIPQVYDKLIAADLKLDLMNIYPDETPVTVVKALGGDGQVIKQVLLYELDHGDFDHLTTVVVSPQPGIASMNELVGIMAKLRQPDGCPWDREQTHESLKHYLIEESYEVIEAIENGDMYNLCEELGDLLLQVVFHAQVAAEAGEFNITDVFRGIVQKLIRRHPHVFGEVKAVTAADVLRAWDEIKQSEKDEQTECAMTFSAPKGLPALMLAAKTQQQVAKVGFDWPDIKGPWAKVQEELHELQVAINDQTGIGEEFGDLLFSLVNLARFLRLDPEDVLRGTVWKFQKRFCNAEQIARQAGYNMAELPLEKMDVFWERAKNQEKSGKMGVV